jgi:hypothetical protein
MATTFPWELAGAVDSDDAPKRTDAASEPARRCVTLTVRREAWVCLACRGAAVKMCSLLFSRRRLLVVVVADSI